VFLQKVFTLHGEPSLGVLCARAQLDPSICYCTQRIILSNIASQTIIDFKKSVITNCYCYLRLKIDVIEHVFKLIKTIHYKNRLLICLAGISLLICLTGIFLLIYLAGIRILIRFAEIRLAGIRLLIRLAGLCDPPPQITSADYLF